jgi:hypothetical protein
MPTPTRTGTPTFTDTPTRQRLSVAPAISRSLTMKAGS